MRVVVVGLGIQGKKRQKVAGSEVVAIVDPVKPEAGYKTIKEVPLDSYDAALVCTPDESKVSLLTYLLKNKKHVLVEKPLLAGAQEIYQLKLLAEDRKVTCYTAYNHRFEPHYVNLKRLIDSGDLGKLYLLRMFYGNGTARDVRNSEWRDQGMGVFSDIGSHLLDITNFWFGQKRTDFQIESLGRFENRAPDYVSVTTTEANPTIRFEATMLSWRNTFTLDLIGELGSAHINCLCKWGPSSFTIRKRILPSGRPEETSETISCPDPTWELEYKHFKTLCQQGGNNLENDLWIGSQLDHMFGEQE